MNQLHKTKPPKNNEGTDYAKFHRAFLGYHFKCKQTGNVYRKLTVFYKDKLAALLMAQLREPSSKYELVDSFGWRNGVKLPEN